MSFRIHVGQHEISVGATRLSEKRLPIALFGFFMTVQGQQCHPQDHMAIRRTGVEFQTPSEYPFCVSRPALQAQQIAEPKVRWRIPSHAEINRRLERLPGFLSILKMD